MLCLGLKTHQSLTPTPLTSIEFLHSLLFAAELFDQD